MDLDLETFLITLYVITDDWYQKVILPKLPACGGPAPKLCDSEVLCLALAAQWRRGVPWKTERGFVRYALKHWRPFFPGMTSQSAFNRRVRRLWGAFILLQQAISDYWLTVVDGEVLDCVPVRVAHGARSFHPGWLADIARKRKGRHGSLLLWAAPLAGRECFRSADRLDLGGRQRARSLVSRTAFERPRRSGPVDRTNDTRRRAAGCAAPGLARPDAGLWRQQPAAHDRRSRLCGRALAGALGH